MPLLVTLATSLQQKDYNAITTFPVLRDVDRIPQKHLKYIQREISTKVPSDELVDGREFIKVIQQYVETNDIIRPVDFVIKSVAKKSNPFPIVSIFVIFFFLVIYTPCSFVKSKCRSGL